MKIGILRKSKIGLFILSFAFYLLLSCGNEITRQLQYGSSSLSPEQVKELVPALETALNSLSNDAAHYAITGPFFVSPGVSITSAYPEETSQRYEVSQPEGVNLFLAYRPDLMFAQHVFYLIAQNKNVIATLSYTTGFWPGVLNADGKIVEELADTQEKREEKIIKTPTISTPRPPVLNFNNFQGSDVPSSICPQVKKIALGIRTYDEYSFKESSKSMHSALQFMGYDLSMFPKESYLLRDRKEIQNKLKEFVTKITNQKNSDLPCCCTEAFIYLGGHGTIEFKSRKGYIGFGEKGIFFKSKAPEYFYEELIEDIWKAFEYEPCVKINVLIEACLSGSAIGAFAIKIPQGIDCSLCLYTPSSAVSPPYTGFMTARIAQCLLELNKKDLDDEVWSCIRTWPTPVLPGFLDHYNPQKKCWH